MNIYQLLLYKKAQVITDLDNYQKREHGHPITVRFKKGDEDKESGVSIDTEIEGLEELEQQMKIPTKWKRPPK